MARPTRSFLLSRFRRLLAVDASPRQLGLAVGIGVLFACTPFFGIQLLLALAVALPLRLNAVAVAIGTQLSIPPFIPIIAYASVRLGTYLLHLPPISIGLAGLQASPRAELLERFGLAWTVGGFALGTIAGLITGTIVAVAVQRVRSRVAEG